MTETQIAPDVAADVAPDVALVDLSRRVGALEARAGAPAPQRPSLVDAAGKLLVPLAVAALALVADLASRRIAASQLELARTIEARQAADAAEARQMKYVELFYRDFLDPAPRKQLAAASLLAVLKPEYSRPLLHAIQSNPSVGLAVRRRAIELVAISRRFGPLMNFRLAVFFDRDSLLPARLANDIGGRLERERFPGDVVMRPGTDSSLAVLGKPTGNEIRFDAHYEDDAARELQAILAGYYPGVEFKLVPINEGRTDDYISIFVSDVPAGTAIGADTIKAASRTVRAPNGAPL